MVQPSAVPRTPDPLYSERDRERETDVIDIGQYLVVLWRRRVPIVVVACVCGAVMLLAGLRDGRAYEAEATLAVSRPKLEGASDATAVGNFLPYLTNRARAAQVMKEFGLEKPPFNMSVRTFFGKVVTVEQVSNSTIIIVRAVLGDPDLAARVANRVAELAVETGRRASQQEALQVRDDIKLQLDESRQRMNDADIRVRTFRDKSQLEVLRKDVDAALDQRGGLLALTIRIETERAKLQKAESELASRQRIDTVMRTIDSEPALMEAARSSGGQSGNAVRLQLKTELMNPVFLALDEQELLNGLPSSGHRLPHHHGD